jgi:hypothetical protein
MLSVLLALSCRPGAQQPLNVVVVVVDGIRVDDGFTRDVSELTGEPGADALPWIWRELMEQGTMVTGARNMGTTVTAPAHAILAVGARTPLANLANDFGPGVYRPVRPTLFEELRLQQGGDAVWVANQALVQPVTWSMAVGYGEDVGADWIFVPSEPGSVQPAPNDAPVFARLERLLREDQPTRVAVNLKAVDRTGHYSATLGGYLEAIELVDRPIVELWAQIQADPHYADNTLLVITSDHGRHRTGEGEYWRNHGDASAGDREIPLLFLGPGVPQGLVVDGPVALADVAPTIAALAGAELPWADGVPIAELVDGGPQGVARVAAHNGVVAEQRWTGDGAHRSQIWVDDVLLSDPEAFAAEAPSVVSDGVDTWVCWRQVTLDSLSMPWIPKCAHLRGDQVVATAAGPESTVGPFWRPQLDLFDGVLVATYVHNPDDIGTAGADDDVAARRAAYTSPGWTVAEPRSTARYPSGPSAAGGVLVFAGSPQTNDARDLRRLYAQTLDWDGADFELGIPDRIDTDDARPLNGVWRVERPAVHADGDRIDVLAQSLGEDERGVVHVQSLDGGRTWQPAEMLTLDPLVPAHLDPLWADGLASWVAGDQICSPTGCWDIGYERVRDWAWDGSSWVLVVQDADGTWVVTTVDR